MNNEPVAWMQTWENQDGELKHTVNIGQIGKNDIPLYTHPVKENCCPDCGCHFTGEYPFNYTVKELTDKEIEEIAEYYGVEDIGICDFVRAILRKAQE